MCFISINNGNDVVVRVYVASVTSSSRVVGARRDFHVFSIRMYLYLENCESRKWRMYIVRVWKCLRRSGNDYVI